MIHIHSLDKLIPIIRILYPSKVIIMHYHGSDIRRKWSAKKKYWKYADAIIVSTKDLLEGAPPNAVYLPNPVNTDLFKPLPELRVPGTALYFYDPLNPALSKDVEWARKIAKELKVKLTVHDRRKNPIPYRKLPFFLNKFEYFIDRHSLGSMSKTGLEALACGLKVVRWDGKVLNKLPKEHEPKNVLQRLAKIYMEALQEKD